MHINVLMWSHHVAVFLVFILSWFIVLLCILTNNDNDDNLPLYLTILYSIWIYCILSNRYHYQQTPEGTHHYIYYHPYRAIDFKGRTVDNIVMKVYEQDDPTCSRLHSDYPDIVSKNRKEYMIAQYLPDQKCSTITLTQPYQSILGNIITKDRFPSFNEGMCVFLCL